MAKRRKGLLGLYLKVLGIILGIFIVLAIVFFSIMRYYLGGIERQDVNHEVLQVNENLEKYEDLGVVNVALFGVDSRNNDDSGRSDAMMVASFDFKNAKVKVVSIARDTYVSVPNVGETKINHAYAYGGPELAIATINQNFNLDITDYVTVNFDQMAEIINELGGIELDVTEAERGQINEYRDPKSPPLAESGYVMLNGEQAVAYSRIRKIDNDNERTNRQRKVLECLFEKGLEVKPTQYPAYVKKFSAMLETSMTDSEILKLALIGIKKNLQMEMDAFPNDHIEAHGERINGLWYYVYDLDEASRMMEQFFYEDIPFGGVPEPTAE